ncbi:Uncharacterized protein OBRU01_12892 [Operophtera brumata]|uniref:LITAF domain-containing protein n=1 Tax=Operophtera brumata TaxID=104452 RepID=A0A0L7L9E0_OPEBR|nr:Uncharacterized protein OBRU01_12892 [Operophtera brumata]
MSSPGTEDLTASVYQEESVVKESPSLEGHPQYPPAYTAEPTMHTTSTNVRFGAGFNAGMGPGYGHMDSGYGHMGPTMVQHHQNGMVTTMTPGVIVTQQFTSRPANITCKSCHAEILTRCERKPTCIPCAIAPYCIDDCKTADHYCPECNAYIGRTEDFTASVCQEESVIKESPSLEGRPQYPPAYTAEPTMHTTSTNVGFGAGYNTGMGPDHVYGHMGQHHQNGMVTTMTAGVIVIQQFTSRPANITCKSCHAEILTRCERKPTFIPCAIAPYYIDDCNRADHYCPECNAYIGSYFI